MKQENPDKDHFPERENLLRDHQVAEMLNVAVSTLRNWRWRNFGPKPICFSKRCVRYRPLDVFKWIAEAGAVR